MYILPQGELGDKWNFWQKNNYNPNQ